MTEAIKVAVRVRPFSAHELQEKCANVVSMSGHTTTILEKGSPLISFKLDFCYCSFDLHSRQYATQELVMSDMGDEIINNALHGFNGCLFAYGQTGSGKSYSMLGYVNAQGIIPRAIEQIFANRSTLEARPDQELRVWISYLEIYNEHFRDLLHAGPPQQDLKVLNHPRLGVLVPGLSEVPATSVDKVQRLMDYGTKQRALSATQLNATSSRSHAVFMMRIQRLEGPRPSKSERDERNVFCSCVQLLDLAGSERQSRLGLPTLPSGCVLSRESVAINQGLTQLGKIVQQLLSEPASCRPRKGDFPFRLSQLTALLQSSLSGNSKTYMLATISPASSSRSETIATLQFASMLREIKTTPTQNCRRFDANSFSLRTWLRKELRLNSDDPSYRESVEFQRQERWVNNMLMRYEEQLDEASQIEDMREQVLRDKYLIQDPLPENTPYLLSMSEDPTLAGCLMFYLIPGRLTQIGRASSCSIQLNGVGIPDRLCTIENSDNKSLSIWKSSSEGRVVINSTKLEAGESVPLVHGQRIFLGRAFAFKAVLPEQAATKGIEQNEDFDLLLDGLDDEWTAIESSASWRNLKDYLEQVVCHLKPEQATALNNEVKRGVQVCEEASEITDELRPQEGLQFEVDLTSTVPAAVVVRVLRVLGDNVGSDAESQSDVLYLWSSRQMQERLDRMRDTYHTWSISGGYCAIDALYDPWHETLPADTIHCVMELEGKLQDTWRERNEAQNWRTRAIHRRVCPMSKKRKSGNVARKTSFSTGRAKSSARAAACKNLKLRTDVPKLSELSAVWSQMGLGDSGSAQRGAIAEFYENDRSTALESLSEAPITAWNDPYVADTPEPDPDDSEEVMIQQKLQEVLKLNASLRQQLAEYQEKERKQLESTIPQPQVVIGADWSTISQQQADLEESRLVSSIDAFSFLADANARANGSVSVQDLDATSSLTRALRSGRNERGHHSGVSSPSPRRVDALLGTTPSSPPIGYASARGRGLRTPIVGPPAPMSSRVTLPIASSTSLHRHSLSSSGSIQAPPTVAVRPISPQNQVQRLSSPAKLEANSRHASSCGSLRTGLKSPPPITRSTQDLSALLHSSPRRAPSPVVAKVSNTSSPKVIPPASYVSRVPSCVVPTVAASPVVPPIGAQARSAQPVVCELQRSGSTSSRCPSVQPAQWFPYRPSQ